MRLGRGARHTVGVCHPDSRSYLRLVLLRSIQPSLGGLCRQRLHGQRLRQQGREDEDEASCERRVDDRGCAEVHRGSPDRGSTNPGLHEGSGYQAEPRHISHRHAVPPRKATHRLRPGRAWALLQLGRFSSDSPKRPATAWLGRYCLFTRLACCGRSCTTRSMRCRTGATT